MLDLHFFKEISQSSCIFRSWTFTAGVLGVVGALKWSHFMTLLGLFSRMHFWWQVQHLVDFTFCKRAKSWQGQWLVRYGIVLVIPLWTAFLSCEVRGRWNTFGIFSGPWFWLEKWHFSGAIALLLGFATIECFDVFVGVSLAGTEDALRFASNMNVVVPMPFASRRQLYSLYWTVHVSQCDYPTRKS